MKKRFLLFLLIIIFIVCAITFYMVLKYVDPFEYPVLGVSVLLFTFVFGLSCILTVILYFIKKIFYRGKVSMHHVMSSFRQSFLICVFFLILIFFNYYDAPMLITAALAFIVLFCLELFVKKQD